MVVGRHGFFPWRVVVEHFGGLLLGCDHVFDLVEDLLVDVCHDSASVLASLVQMACATLLLSLLEQRFGVHFVEDGRDTGTGLTVAAQALNLHVVLGAADRVIVDDSGSAALFLVSHWLLRLLRIQDGIDAEEGLVLLRAHKRSTAWHGRQSWLRRLARTHRLGLLLPRRRTAFLETCELGSQFLELEQALDLELLGINDALAVLVHDVDVGEEALDDGLEARVLDLQNRSILKQRERAARLEDLLGDVDDALDGDFLISQRGQVTLVCTTTLVTIDYAVDDSMRLHEEVNVLRRVHVAQEILVHSHQELDVLVSVHCAPYRAKFMVDVFEIAQVLQL